MIHSRYPLLQSSFLFISLLGILFLLYWKVEAGLINPPLYLGLNTGLVGFWSFDQDDVAGTTVYDRSGKENNGTLTNSPRQVVGRVGQALEFDGTSSYVSLGNRASLDMGAKNFTFSAWIRYTDTSNVILFSNKVRCRSGGVAEWRGYCVYQDNNGLVLSVTDTNNTFAQTIHTTGYNDGAWHFLVVTAAWSGSSLDVRFYRDGVEVFNQSLPSLSGSLGTTNAVAGISKTPDGADGGTQHFKGTIDEVRVYDRALTAQEIQRLYRIGTTFKIGAFQGQKLINGIIGRVLRWPEREVVKRICT
jgi:hypothetical protein